MPGPPWRIVALRPLNRAKPRPRRSRQEPADAARRPRRLPLWRRRATGFPPDERPVPPRAVRPVEPSRGVDRRLPRPTRRRRWRRSRPARRARRRAAPPSGDPTRRRRRRLPRPADWSSPLRVSLQGAHKATAPSVHPQPPATAPPPGQHSRTRPRPAPAGRHRTASARARRPSVQAPVPAPARPPPERLRASPPGPRPRRVCR